MELNKTLVRKLLKNDLTEVMIRVGIIAFMVVMSVRVFMPFVGIVLWGLIGLFVGAVVLALGYVIFMAWVDKGDEPAAEQTVTEDLNAPFSSG